jgi:hypothetical protein
VPRSLHLSASSAKTSRLAPILDAVQEATFGDESGVLALFLLHERAIGRESHVWPYLSVLPTAEELDVPLLWDAEERARLLGGVASHPTVTVRRVLLLSHCGRMGDGWVLRLRK